jgi:hypothetical protein
LAAHVERGGAANSGVRGCGCYGLGARENKRERVLTTQRSLRRR